MFVALVLAAVLEPVVWSQQTAPAAGPPHSIGSATNGCLRGAEALAPSGPGYDVMRVFRRRFFGHPRLVTFIKRTGKAVMQAGLPGLAIGDLGQARGGPLPSGHRSHQTGLDVDVGFVTAPATARETWSPVAVVDLKTGSLLPTWRPSMARYLELAAFDSAVDRIFVHAAIKRELCRIVPTKSGQRPAWLRKVRPWWAHHDHFHVRLGCAPADELCEPQAPLPAGDGCGKELNWWFSAEAKAGPKPTAAGKEPSPMPGACAELVEQR